jgi:hypothetical protein
MPCALLETLFPTQKDTYPISRGAMVEAKKKKKKKIIIRRRRRRS